MIRRIRLIGITGFCQESPGATSARVFAVIFALVAAGTSLQAIDGLQVILAPNSSSFIRWDDTGNEETGYRIERKAGSAVYEEVVTAPANTVSYTDSGLSPETEYTYRVTPIIAGSTAAGLTATLITPPEWQIPQARPSLSIQTGENSVLSFDGADATYTVEKTRNLVEWETLEADFFLSRHETAEYEFADSANTFFRVQSQVYEHPLQIGLDRPFEMPPEPNGETWDVTSFGASPAKFDATNDDAIFIKIVLGLANPGDVVLIPEGTYTIRQILKIPDGVTLRGAGMDKTILVTEEISRAVNIDPEAHDIRLESFAIQHLGTEEELQYGVYIGSARQGRNSYRILMDSLKVEGFSKHAISLRDCNHVLVQNCHFLNATNLGGGGFGYGVALNYPTNHNNWIRNNTIGPVIRHAVLIQYYAHNNLVEHNLAIENSEDCYDLHGEDEYLNELRYNVARDCERDGFGVGNTGSTHDRSGPNNWIHHNTVENCNAGVEVIQGSEMVFIDSNTLIDNNYGIRVYNGSGNQIYIRGNTIRGNERGISLLNTRWVWLEDNKIEDQTLYGIEILTGVEDLTEKNNILTGNAADYGP